MSDEIHKERRRIAFRLCGFFIPLNEIADGTCLPLEEVQAIKQLREDYYNRKVEEDPRNYTKARSWELDDIEQELKIEKALANAKASLAVEGLSSTDKGEELVRSKLMGEITAAEFLEQAKRLANGDDE